MSIFEPRQARRPLAEEAREAVRDQYAPKPQTSIVKPIRDILEKVAHDDKNSPADPFAPPVIRQIQTMAGEIADEHGIAQPERSYGSKLLDELGTANSPSPIPNSKALEPYTGSPLKDLAKQFEGFTYGTMMTLAKELKAVEHATFETPENIAALLHTWASKTLQNPSGTQS